MKFKFTKSNPPVLAGVTVKQHVPDKNGEPCKFPQTGDRDDCNCPKCFYITPGRLRISAKTRSWAKALVRGNEWVKEHDPNQKQAKTFTPKPIDEAFADFIDTKLTAGLKRTTVTKIRTISKQLKEFIAQWNLEHKKAQLVYIHEVDLEVLKAFYGTWTTLSGKTKQKRIGYLREFFDHCLQAEWIENSGETVPDGKHAIPKSNPANFLKSTGRGGKAKDKMPLSPTLYKAFLKGCETLAETRRTIKGTAERLRMFFETAYNTGFAITDTAIVEKRRLRKWKGEYYFDVQRRKLEGSDASKPIWMKIDSDFAQRLLAMPAPHPKYFFWNGNGEVDNACDGWQRLFVEVRDLLDAKMVRREMLQQIIPDEDGEELDTENILPTFHCFRYSFVQNLFLNRADVPMVAMLTGDTPAVIVKHYMKFSRQLQEASNEVLDRVHRQNRKLLAPHTFVAQIPEAAMAQA
jgi:site-specific recombinase XerD